MGILWTMSSTGLGSGVQHYGSQLRRLGNPSDVLTDGRSVVRHRAGGPRSPQSKRYKLSAKGNSSRSAKRTAIWRGGYRVSHACHRLAKKTLGRGGQRQGRKICNGHIAIWEVPSGCDMKNCGVGDGHHPRLGKHLGWFEIEGRNFQTLLNAILFWCSSQVIHSYAI